jgi:uncharacterized repeat protein (TIGR03943 family)
LTNRGYRSLQGLILALTAAMLFGKVGSGTLFYYINVRFLPLTLLGVAALLWLAQALYMGARSRSEEEHDDAHDPPEGLHDHDQRRSPRRLILLCLPLLLGTVVPARALGASAVATKGLSLSAPAPVGGGAPITIGVASQERTVLDWVRLFAESDGPGMYVGQPADVIGFVYADPRLPQGSFLVARFTIACCVADAFAIGVIVDWPQAESLTPNTWVRVRGPMSVGEVEGQTLPRIQAESVDSIQPPDQPYLFP